jgi:hypothetical protein
MKRKTSSDKLYRNEHLPEVLSQDPSEQVQLVVNAGRCLWGQDWMGIVFERILAACASYDPSIPAPLKPETSIGRRDLFNDEYLVALYRVFQQTGSYDLNVAVECIARAWSYRRRGPDKVVAAFLQVDDIELAPTFYESCIEFEGVEVVKDMEMKTRYNGFWSRKSIRGTLAKAYSCHLGFC